MKRIDFENDTVTKNIINAAFPLLVAQIMSLLYNVVDRIYIARIPSIGTYALGAIGLCFPLIVIINSQIYSAVEELHYSPLAVEKRIVQRQT